MDAKDQKIALLEEQIEALQFANDELQSAICDVEALDGFPPLTSSYVTILSLLARHGARTNAQIYAALYAGRISPPEPRIVKVWITKLRRAVEGSGIEIITRWGVGYELEAKSRERVLEAMRAFKARQSGEQAA